MVETSFADEPREVAPARESRVLSGARVVSMGAFVSGEELDVFVVEVVYWFEANESVGKPPLARLPFHVEPGVEFCCGGLRGLARPMLHPPPIHNVSLRLWDRAGPSVEAAAVEAVLHEDQGAGDIVAIENGMRASFVLKKDHPFHNVSVFDSVGGVTCLLRGMAVVLAADKEQYVAGSGGVLSRESERHDKALWVRYGAYENESADAIIPGKHLGNADPLRIGEDINRPAGESIGNTDSEIDKEGSKSGLSPVRVADGSFAGGLAGNGIPPCVAGRGVGGIAILFRRRYHARDEASEQGRVSDGGVTRTDGEAERRMPLVVEWQRSGMHARDVKSNGFLGVAGLGKLVNEVVREPSGEFRKDDLVWFGARRPVPSEAIAGAAFA